MIKKVVAKVKKEYPEGTPLDEIPFERTVRYFLFNILIFKMRVIGYGYNQYTITL